MQNTQRTVWANDSILPLNQVVSVNARNHSKFYFFLLTIRVVNHIFFADHILSVLDLASHKIIPVFVALRNSFICFSNAYT